MNSVNKIFRTMIIGILCLGAMSIYGCYSLDHTQKEWIGDGEETIYLGRLDSLYVRSGMNRVEIVGGTKYLRTATTCKVEFDDTSLIYKVSDIVQSDGTARVMVNDLSGGSYYFKVTMFDEDGNKSVPSKVYGRAYGKTDLLLESPRRIISVIPKPDGSMDLNWSSNSSTYVILKYEDADGNLVTQRIDDDPDVTNIASWKKGGTITATTYILKNEDDLDILELVPFKTSFPAEIQLSIPRFGQGSWMNMGNSNDYDITQSFTVEIRARYTELVNGDQCIISCENKPSSGFMLRSSGNRVQFYIGSGSAGWQGVASGAIETGVWYDFAITYKANDQICLYVNGQLVSSRACAAMAASSVALQAGTSPIYNNRYMRGDIQHISIWSQVKTEAEIGADIERGYGFNGTEEGLKAYWPLTVNYGNAIEDVTGNHTATFANVTWNSVN